MLNGAPSCDAAILRTSGLAWPGSETRHLFLDLALGLVTGGSDKVPVILSREVWLQESDGCECQRALGEPLRITGNCRAARAA